MPTGILSRNKISQATGLAEVDSDRESPAGPTDTSMRCLDRRAYVYRGQAESHWIGQPCGVEGADPTRRDHEAYRVVFACGCRGLVPAAELAAARVPAVA